MMRQKSFAQLAAEWGTLLGNSIEDLAALPHTQRPHDELQALHTRLVALNERIELQRSDLQLVVRERQDLVKTSRRPRKSLESMLLAEFGDDSQRLVRYGISPKAPRKRKSKKEVRQELLEEIQKENGSPEAKAAVAA